MTTAIHVVPALHGGWSVKSTYTTRARKHFRRKKDAVRYARSVCRGLIYIHGKDGCVQIRMNPAGV